MNQKENHSKAAVLGLQHLLAMYSGSILVPIMIAGALGYSPRTTDIPYLYRYLYVWGRNSLTIATQ